MVVPLSWAMEREIGTARDKYLSQLQGRDEGITRDCTMSSVTMNGWDIVGRRIDCVNRWREIVDMHVKEWTSAV